MSERVHRSVMNIKVGMLFYVLSLFLAFFSRRIFLDCLGAEFIGLTWSLLAVAGFYALLLLLVYGSRKSWIERPLVKYLSRLLLN